MPVFNAITIQLVLLGALILKGFASTVSQIGCDDSTCEGQPICPSTTCNYVYPSKVDCDVYYLIVEGKSFQHRCSPGLIFNPDAMTCDYDSNVNCSLKISTVAFTTAPEIVFTTNSSMKEVNFSTIDPEYLSTKHARSTSPENEFFTSKSEFTTTENDEDESKLFSNATTIIDKTAATNHTPSEKLTPASKENEFYTITSPGNELITFSDETSITKITTKNTITTENLLTTIKDEEASTFVSPEDISIFSSDGTTVIKKITTSPMTTENHPTASKKIVFSPAVTTEDNSRYSTKNTTTPIKQTTRHISTEELPSTIKEERFTSDNINTTEKATLIDMKTIASQSTHAPLTSEVSSYDELTEIAHTTTRGSTPPPFITITRKPYSSSTEPTPNIDVQTTNNPIETEASTSEELQFQCPSQFGLFPDPENCTGFYQCSQWIPHQKFCPSNLQFNPASNVCDWSYRAGCEKSTTEITFSTKDKPTSEIKNSTLDENYTSATNIPNEETATTHIIETTTKIPSTTKSLIVTTETETPPTNTEPIMNEFTTDSNKMSSMANETNSSETPSTIKIISTPNIIYLTTEDDTSTATTYFSSISYPTETEITDLSTKIPEITTETIMPTKTSPEISSNTSGSYESTITTKGKLHITSTTKPQISNITSTVESTIPDGFTTEDVTTISDVITITPNITSYITSITRPQISNITSTVESTKLDSSTTEDIPDVTTISDLTTMTTNGTPYITSTTRPQIPNITSTVASTIPDGSTTENVPDITTIPDLDIITEKTEVPITTSEQFISTTITSIEKQTDGDLSVFECPSRFGLYPDSKNCSLFYHCSNYVPHHKICPSDLHFNPSTKVCDWPEAAGCGNLSHTTSGENLTQSTLPATTSTTTKNDSHPIFICPSRFGLFPDSENCFKFYHCSHGIPYHKFCPSNLHFNPKLQICDWPYKAGCGNLSHTTTSFENFTQSTLPATTSPTANNDSHPIFTCPSRFGLFPDSENCFRFYHCSHRIPYHKLCPSNLHFNPTLQICDWPFKAGCEAMQR